MNTTQANRKWNQGYVMPDEPKELHAVVRCKDCVYSESSPKYYGTLRCCFDPSKVKLKVAVGGSCRSATPK